MPLGDLPYTPVPQPPHYATGGVACPTSVSCSLHLSWNGQSQSKADLGSWEGLWWTVGCCRTNKWGGLFWPSAFDWKRLVIKTLRQSCCELYLMVVKGGCERGGRNGSRWCIGRSSGFSELLNGRLSASGTYWRRWMLGIRCEGRMGNKEAEREYCLNISKEIRTAVL